jgi:hypothetical protein
MQKTYIQHAPDLLQLFFAPWNWLGCAFMVGEVELLDNGRYIFHRGVRELCMATHVRKNIRPAVFEAEK